MNSYNDLIIDIQDILKENFINGRILEKGALENNAFSITFPITFGDDNSREYFYIKIPKIIFYDKDIDFFTPFTEQDILLAKNEYSSLNILQERWPVLNGVNFVEPVAFLQSHNAIITKLVKGEFLFEKIRNLDVSFLSPRNDFTLVRGLKALKNFGYSLGNFHYSSANKKGFKLPKYISELESYLFFLSDAGIDNSFLDVMKREILSLEISNFGVYEVDCLKGIDIRQFFLLKNDELKIIDPGKIFKSYAETDLARFIVTYRILHWGTWKALVVRNIESSFEKEFIDSYKTQISFSREVLSLLIIKELLKQWIVILKSLEFRSWNGILKFFYKNYYLNPFFKRLLEREIKYFKSEFIN